MKTKFSKIISICLIIAMFGLFSATAYAEDEELNINDGAKVNVGDRVKFTLSLSDADTPVIGFELRLFYDDSYLELDKNSVNFPEFDNVVYNPDISNMIPMNWTNINTGIDFSSKKEFVSFEFRVLKGGETDISQFVTELYGDDLTYLKTYTWTYSISVNGEDVVTDQTPKIYADEDTLNNHTGGIVNYLDGRGEQNASDKDNHEVYDGQDIIIQNNTKVVTDVEEVTRTVEGSNSSDKSEFPWTVLIIGAAVLIVILAVVGVIIVKRHDDLKSENNVKTEEENSENID